MIKVTTIVKGGDGNSKHGFVERNPDVVFAGDCSMVPRQVSSRWEISMEKPGSDMLLALGIYEWRKLCGGGLENYLVLRDFFSDRVL